MNRQPDATRDLSLPGPDAELVELTPESVAPVLLGRATPEVTQAVQSFVRGVASMFETWLKRSANANTQRTYRRGVLSFVEFLGLPWPEFDGNGSMVPGSKDESWKLLSASVADVRAWRDELLADGQAPATLNARLSALSGFYRFMRESVATELNLPIQVPNPAHAQFISRESKDPVDPTMPLGLTNARKLMSMPQGDDVFVARDRAILKVFLYSGIRLGTACRLSVEDFHDDPEDPTIAIQEKGRGRSRRRIGINHLAADALREYMKMASLTGGPLFRAKTSSRGANLAERHMSEAVMYRVLMRYLERVPGAMFEEAAKDDQGSPLFDASGQTVTVRRCRYTPHSLRATTATLLDEAHVGIKKIQELLGHRDIRVTQTYIKLGNDSRNSASHEVPL